MNQCILIIYCALLSPILSTGASRINNKRWLSDDHVSVHISKKDNLADLIWPGEYSRIKTLTLSEKLADKDFFYIKNNLKAVETIDMSALTNTEIPTANIQKYKNNNSWKIFDNISAVE